MRPKLVRVVPMLGMLAIVRFMLGHVNPCWGKTEVSTKMLLLGEVNMFGTNFAHVGAILACVAAMCSQVGTMLAMWSQVGTMLAHVGPT